MATGQQPDFGNLQFNNAQASLLGSVPQAGTAQVGVDDVGGGALGASLYSQALGANGLGQVGTTLQGRAQTLAQSTGAMTPDELRAMQQDIRGAYAARGTEMGGGAISAEALGRLTNERQNQQNDLGLAAALNAQNQAELGANRGFQQGVQGADLGRQFQNQGVNLQAQGMNQEANLRASLANQGMAGQYGLANQSAQNQFGLYNSQQGLATQDANRAFGYGQYGDQLRNLGMLGQLDASRLGQDRAYALQLAQMQAAIAADPFQAILGRQSGALQYGAGQQGFAGGLTQSMQGPQLFNPDTGINLALTNAGNLGRYQAATYGAQAGAQGAMMGGLFQGLGSLGGAAIAKCHVAREVYGDTNPKWFDFFIWKEFFAPAWFRWLYNKFSVQVAALIRPFPRLKNLIRLWMDKKIKEL